MTCYEKQDKKSLENEYEILMKKYEEFKLLNLNLDMSRGKPSTKQLDLSSDMLKNIDINWFKKTSNNQDARNYCNLNSLVEPKEFFSNILDVPIEMIFIGSNSSLNLMYSYIDMAMQFGILKNKPWNKLEEVKFLCPTPGYDRHFAICELFNIKMINIKMTKDGPDINQVQKLVESDSSIKGIWCVPKYSNPTGITYSNEMVKAFSKLKPKAQDFRVFWDNAYVLHGFNEKDDFLLNIFDEAKKHNNEDMILEFTSTSKISFPGSGISAIATSKENVKEIERVTSKQTVCFNNINQILHCKFFNSYEKLINHMKNHAKILKPKFDLVLKTFEKELQPFNLGEWTKPNGGYFVSFNSLKGCAKKICKLCKDVGLTLTAPGSTFPYFNDPDDCNIRIAPTYPEIEELKIALEIFCVCVKIATIEKISN